MKFEACLFDFNGLIIDDEAIHFELFKKILREEEIDLTEKDYWEKYLGFDDKGLIEAVFLASKKNVTPKKIKDLIQKKNKLYFPALKNKLRLFPGVDEFIKKVSHSFSLAIVSGALRSEIEYVLKETNLFSFFPIIISAHETKHGKPDPEGYLLALSGLKKNNPKIVAANCLVLEDSQAGIEAAKRARMTVYALAHTYPPEQLENADKIFKNFDEIENFMKLY
ncbi:MAG: hypothetical protein A3G32_01305 [Deltaproteobacteria bacterium RIFCSPLOWO2_12_FULL_40_28]|nr:MAG: hypothetical protein A3C45_10190 [Deltaproteobacteria bacterium RIFCSPHIGHO2_02_FULL_40_28]OGQ19966.1 MAG: hypothetical protein A3E27_07140 [Deltaproteobacteria bacterium RIFCSPHIGHO2_12_FULL_40_32]OGQ39726.1 MAG: hypothetical protein A3I69_06570 [Deltaproteobacteria bacterium RIFCSPLOWO2_02_FULL_40_36]OGQ52981.1 MAG: hypothetical protein A3G32_01305 [Deltaproteobacteria bacterium RIFCSPLOWO2_12_FULL_40_28]